MLSQNAACAQYIFTILIEASSEEKVSDKTEIASDEESRKVVGCFKVKMVCMV